MAINFELEKEVLGALLKDPKVIKDIHVEAEWFFNPIYQEIFVVLDILKGDVESIFDIYSHLNAMNKNTQVNFALLNEIKENSITSSNVSSNARSLHKQYLDVKLINLSQKASMELTDDIVSSIRDVITERERMSISEDMGDIEEAIAEIEYSLDNDVPTGLKTFGNLDFMLGGGIDRGELFVVGARPSVGKTAFAGVNMSDRMITRNENMKVDLFSLEMSKVQMVKRYVTMYTGISSHKLKDANNILLDKEKKKVINALDRFKKDDYKLKVHDDRFYLHDILNIIKTSVFEHGTGNYAAIIDHLGLIKVGTKYENRRLEIEYITRELRVLANQLNVPIIVLSQLSRGIEGRADKKPVLSDLRDSGSIEQDASVVAFLYRPDDENREDITLSIQKNREGSVGDVKFKFDGSKMRFDEIY